VPGVELVSKLPALAAEQLREAQTIRIEPERYVGAVRDWVANGERSRFVLAPEEVITRSQARDDEHSRAAACFELGQHLQRTGKPGEAIDWFREAHRLAPENWTYKRQAWSLLDPLQGPTDAYESDWLTEFRKVGGEGYYPPLQM
jgi:tetratricopeptide (TPR) repeat protein